jgi:hypothetical protein
MCWYFAASDFLPDVHISSVNCLLHREQVVDVIQEIVAVRCGCRTTPTSYRCFCDVGDLFVEQMRFSSVRNWQLREQGKEGSCSWSETRGGASLMRWS